MKIYSIPQGIQEYRSAFDFLQKMGHELTINRTGKRPTEEELCLLSKEYDALIVGVKDILSAKVYQSKSRLKYIGTLSTGLDHIDPRFLGDPQIKIIKCPEATVYAVAEFVAAYIIGKDKPFSGGNIAFREGKSREELADYPWQEITGRKIGFVGAGKISSQMTRLLSPFFEEFLCWTFHPDLHRDLEEQKVKFVALDELLSQIDILVIALPLSPETLNLISSDKLDLLGKRVCIINIARPSIMEMDSFLSLAQKGYFSGSLIDCFSEEVDISSAQKTNNIIFTPHIAGISKQAVDRLWVELASGLKNAFQE